MDRALLLHTIELLEREAARLLMLAGQRAKSDNVLLRQREELLTNAAELRRSAG